jgi:hypothetical protein
VATAGDFPPGGVGSALSDQITATARDAGIEVTVEVTRFGEYHTVWYIVVTGQQTTFRLALHFTLHSPARKWYCCTCVCV